MPLLSIVVPIYNGEEYVDSLLETFERQSQKDFEVIIVDDGSTDGTLQKLYSRAASMSYPIRIESIEPSGVSAARNRGIDVACGKYISFVDSDDQIVSNYVEVLKKVAARNAFDVYIFASYRTDPSDSFQKKGKASYKKTDSLTMLHRLAVNPTQYGVYNLFVEKKFLDEHEFRFAEEFEYYEDYDLLFRIFAAGERMLLSESALYYYVLQKGSAVATYSLDRFEDIALLELLVPYLRQIQPQYSQEFERWFLPRIWWSLLWQSCLAFSHRDWKRFVEISNIAERIQSLKGHPDRKVRLSTKLFLSSPEEFFHAVRMLGRSRSRVEHASLEPFVEYFSVVEDAEDAAKN